MKHCQSSDFAISNWIHFVFKSISNELVCVSDVPMLRKLHIIKFAQQFVWPKNTMSKQLHMNWSSHLVTLWENFSHQHPTFDINKVNTLPTCRTIFNPFLSSSFFILSVHFLLHRVTFFVQTSQFFFHTHHPRKKRLISFLNHLILFVTAREYIQKNWLDFCSNSFLLYSIFTSILDFTKKDGNVSK